MGHIKPHSLGQSRKQRKANSLVTLWQVRGLWPFLCVSCCKRGWKPAQGRPPQGGYSRHLLGGSSGDREPGAYPAAPSSPGPLHHPGLGFAVRGRETVTESMPLVLFQGFPPDAASSSVHKDGAECCCCHWLTTVTAAAS